MKTTWTMRLAAIVFAGLLAGSAAIAAPLQSQQSSQQSQQTTQQQAPDKTQQQTPQPPQQQPPAPNQQSDSSSQPEGAQGPAPVAQSNDPNVKKGSEADVDAVGNRNVGHGLNFYSLEHEIALGKQLAQEVDRSAKFITDPVVTEYVNRVGQNLVRNSDAQVPFTIKVIDSDQINAFALPGGFFYVNSGLIMHADEESELAGVMAHEIAHVCARHGTKNATKGQIMQLATIPLVMLGPGGWAGYAIYQGAQLIVPISFLKFSRDAEREADYLGLQYMYKAGYDPNSFVSFFEKVDGTRKEAARLRTKDLRNSSAHARSHRSGTEGNCHDPAGARRIHRLHFRIRCGEAPPRND